MLTGNERPPGARSHRSPDTISTYKGQERALHAGRIGTAGLFFSIVAASAPLTVIAGGAATTFAVTGVVSTPLTYIVLGVVLALFAVGYAEMSHHVHNAGGFYAYIARGLGGTLGAGASFVALAAYNSIQAGIYGMFGAQLSGLVKEWTGTGLDWWVCALIGIAVVGVLGAMKVDISAKVLGVMLVLEIILVLVLDFAFLGDPGPAGIDFGGLSLDGFSGSGLGAALALAVAAFMGFESASVYAEEANKPQVAIGRATLWAVGFTAIFYAFSSWTVTVATGSDKIVGAAREEGPNLLFTLGSDRVGSTVSDVMKVLFITSLFAALLSFHNAVARYFFAMGREGLLPQAVGRASNRTGAPALGSYMQTVVALLVVGVFAFADKDPVLELFTWMGNVGAIGLLALMATTSVAVIAFFVKRGAARAQAWRIVTSALAALLLAAVLVLSIVKFDVLLGSKPDDPLVWILPSVIGAAAVIGLGYGLVLKATRPAVHARIGLGKEAFQLDRAAEQDNQEQAFPQQYQQQHEQPDQYNRPNQ